MPVDPPAPQPAPQPPTDLDAVRRVEELIRLLESQATGMREQVQRSAEAAGRAASAAGDAEAAQRVLDEVSRLATTSREAADRVAAAAKRFDDRQKTATKTLDATARRVGEAARDAEARVERARKAEVTLQILLEEVEEKGDVLDNVRALAFEAHSLAKSAGSTLDTRVATVERQLAHRVDQSTTRLTDLERRGRRALWAGGTLELVLAVAAVALGLLVWDLWGENRELAGEVARLETTMEGVASEMADVRASATQASSQAQLLAAQVDGDLRERRRRDLFAATPTALINGTSDPARAAAASAALRSWGLDIVFERDHPSSGETGLRARPSSGTSRPRAAGISSGASPANRRTRIYYRRGGQRAAEELATLTAAPIALDTAGPDPFYWEALGVPPEVEVAVVLEPDGTVWGRSASASP